MNSQRIVFNYKSGNIQKSDNIPLKSVRTYLEGFYKEGEQIPEQVLTWEKTDYSYAGLFINAGLGTGHLTRKKEDNIDPRASSYLDDIKNGKNKSIGLRYYIQPLIGFYFLYSNFTSDAEIETQFIDGIGSIEKVSFSEDIKLNSLNLGFCTSQPIDKYGFIELSVGVQRTAYTNDPRYREGSYVENYSESSKAIGFHVGLSPHVRVTEHIYFFACARYLTTRVKEISWTARNNQGGKANGSQQTGYDLDFNRYELNLGVSINFGK
ncbi:MAG: hypothetical protein ACPF8V_07530 [Luteibaculum sp.]